MGGYAGGFVGPLLCRVVLHLTVRACELAWGLAFGHVALIVLAGYAVLRHLGQEG